VKSINNIKELIKKGEDSYVEFKEKITSIDSLSTEMVAFANLKGGIILIGIDDHKNIIGLSDNDIEKSQQQITNIATNNIKPILNIIVKNIQIDNKSIIYLEILNTNPPYQDKNGIFWIRRGSSKNKASNEELVRLFAKGKLFHIDEQDTKAKISDTINMVDFNLFLDSNYSMLRTQERNNYEKLLYNLNLANSKGYFNLAGLLVFAKNPQLYYPMLNIECCYFDSNDSSSNRFIDRESINGNIDELYKQSMNFIKRNIKRKQIGDEFNQSGELEINEQAIIEAIVNAIIHRDLSTLSSTKIYLFKNRLEIISVGSLPNHLNIEKIKKSISIKRNQTIHLVATKILPYSGLGTGIKRILELEPSVEFINDENMEQFIVKFKR
jgi:predicted HTH transcriptional regulator